MSLDPRQARADLEQGSVELPANRSTALRKTTARLSAILASLTIAATLGCAATSTREGTGEYIDETVITTTVKAAILDDPALKVSEINVETFNGVVQLSGFVGTKAMEARAVEVARGVSGVKSVKDAMQVK